MNDIDDIFDMINNGYLTEDELNDFIEYGFILYEDENTSIKDKIKNSKLGKLASHPVSKTVASLGSKVAIAAPVAAASWKGFNHLKDKAVSHAGNHASAVGGAMDYAPGAIAGAYAGYKLYKHFKAKKKMNEAHKEATNEAMKNIEKTHPHLSISAKPHVHDEIKNVINMHKDEFKKNPQDIHKKIVDHFKSDDFKNKMIEKAKE